MVNNRDLYRNGFVIAPLWAKVIVASFFLTLLWPASADAQITAVAGGNPNHLDLAIPVTASVAARCDFTIGGTFTVPDINAGFSHDFEIVLQCNVASRMAVVSINGGLLASVSAPPVGYARLAPYRATLNLVGAPGVTTVNAICDAAILIAGAAAPCSFRGPASPIQGLRLSGPSSSASGSYLRVSAVPYAGAGTLVASSTYADTLLITLSASI
ncbi:hypothetical protein [Parasphingorhabdus sp.]|jgi:hypothetical protein|uniref:hypothetical protein n=1 Tax=Parasphingorhabdus sp. TaxID=2709688 RepID=UPI0039E570AA